MIGKKKLGYYGTLKAKTSLVRRPCWFTKSGKLTNLVFQKDQYRYLEKELIFYTRTFTSIDKKMSGFMLYRLLHLAML